MVERRAFRRKAAPVGTGAFAVPMIITIEPADAQALTSPPPEPAGSPATSGTRQVTPTPTRRAVSRRTEPPRTGANLDRLTVAGLTATAGGAALVLCSADRMAAAASSPGRTTSGTDTPTTDTSTTDRPMPDMGTTDPGTTAPGVTDPATTDTSITGNVPRT